MAALILGASVALPSQPYLPLPCDAGSESGTTMLTMRSSADRAVRAACFQSLDGSLVRHFG